MRKMSNSSSQNRLLKKAFQRTNVQTNSFNTCQEVQFSQKGLNATYLNITNSLKTCWSSLVTVAFPGGLFSTRLQRSLRTARSSLSPLRVSFKSNSFRKVKFLRLLWRKTVWCQPCAPIKPNLKVKRQNSSPSCCSGSKWKFQTPLLCSDQPSLTKLLDIKRF